MSRKPRARRPEVRVAEAPSTPHLVLGAGLLLVLVQLAFRTWALAGSGFYADDYALLLEAQEAPLSVEYLLMPWNSHLMPGGRLVAWLVAHSGTLNWGLAATLVLALQAASSLAAYWMLRELFGTRWGILLPLSLYLSTAMTVPAFMWWTANLNQLATQLGFFLAVGFWVRYLRRRRLRWAAAAYGAVGIGLLFDVKALLVLLVLALLALAYFTTGGLGHRLVDLLRRYWPAGALLLPPLLAYLLYYRASVQQPFLAPSWRLVGELADTMVGEAFVSALVGGPWRWEPHAAPNSYADPPEWALRLSWVVVALVLCYAALTRLRTGRGWAILAAYLTALYLLLLSSRAVTFGADIGLEYRYLTDAACMAALAVGLAFLELRHAPGSSGPRPEPVLRRTAPRWLVTTAVVLVSVSGYVSAAGAILHWHRDNDSISFVTVLREQLRDQGSVDLVDQPAPDGVLPAVFAPANRVQSLVELVSGDARFPDTTSRLAVVTATGELRTALIQPVSVALPGPVTGCGWQLDSRGATIPLGAPVPAGETWLRIGYLSSAGTEVRLGAGGTTRAAYAPEGLGSLYVRTDGDFDSVTVSGIEDGVTLCVDTVEAGTPVPGGRLP